MIEELRARIKTEELDYQTLVDALREYAHPRDKISDLIWKDISGTLLTKRTN
jgi:hypothetical protein